MRGPGARALVKSGLNQQGTAVHAAARAELSQSPRLDQQQAAG